MFRGSTSLAGPKHSTSVPFSMEIAVPLSVDVKRVALVPNSAPDVAVKAPPGPQIREVFDLCGRIHSSLVLLPTLQVVNPLMSPATLHLKVKLPPGQVGGAAVSRPTTSPGDKYSCNNTKLHYTTIVHTYTQVDIHTFSTSHLFLK